MRRNVKAVELKSPLFYDYLLMAVRILPEHVINQISAGEVIERPVSVVRELVDNAVDAQASDISVTLYAAGKTMIRVTDDGSGMKRDDAILSFERHATSKLNVAEDLIQISTLGFRGEALPSIASIAKVKMKTKIETDPLGTELIIESGELKSVRDVAAKRGTEIEVKSLFYNTPARRNFLKSNRTEEARVKQWLSGFALIHPEIRFRLYLDEAESMNLARRSTVLERAHGMMRGSTVTVDFTNQDFNIEGVIAHPAQAQFDTSGFIIFVNKRLVSDRTIMKAAKEGFDSMLKSFEYPAGFLSINMPPELVDVNVHPQKSEVRFRKPQEVFIAVRSAVLAAVKKFRAPVFLNNTAWSPPLTRSEPQRSEQPPIVSNLALEWGAPPPEAAEPVRDYRSEFRYSDLKFVGQIFACYLLCTLKDNFYVIDMHAAHERCNYNILHRRLEQSQAQQLLVPIVVELSEYQLEEFIEHTAMLKRFNIEVEKFSENSVAVRAIPAILKPETIPDLIREIAAAEQASQVESAYREALDHEIARLACHASIRSGYILEREEVYALFSAMDQAELAGACPHGRPVAAQFSSREIEKWFGRDR